jgi:transcriptional regulator with XRE-family HTH domain
VSDLGNRILERIEALGLTQSELARRVGITQPAIANLIKRGGRSSHLHAIARELETTPEYLLLGGDDIPAATSGISSAARAEALDTVEIAEFNVAYGLGGAFIHDEPARQTMRTFSLAWVRQFTAAPIDKLFWQRARAHR